MSRRDDLRGFWKNPSPKEEPRVWIGKRKREKFYHSREWLELRYKALLFYGRRCMCCGAGPADRQLQVDHIKSRRAYPELQLDIKNLQILCSTCNQGKGWRDDTDFRMDFLSIEQIQHLKDM